MDIDFINSSFVTEQIFRSSLTKFNAPEEYSKAGYDTFNTVFLLIRELGQYVIYNVIFLAFYAVVTIMLVSKWFP